MWDTFEEFRALTLIEKNGRDLLKEHLLIMLSFQRIYWKQRVIIKWVKFGDEKSKFYQAKATIKCRNNYVHMLQDEHGTEYTEHHPKAAILWKAFKERLRQSVPQMTPLS